MLQGLVRSIAGATGLAIDPGSAEAASGGCIHQSFAVAATGGARYFLKCNSADALPLFDAERVGLLALRAAGAVRAPEPLATGVAGDRAWLLLEYLPLARNGDGAAGRLGTGLARLHRHTGPQFGFDGDNYIGATPQRNAPAAAWPEFFRDRRLRFQLELAARQGHRGELQRRGARLLDAVPALLAGHDPVPSLLHGDLWGGNWGALPDGTPVIFDPAVYHGDREADIAMTALFGGFGPAFRRAYEAEWPLPPGFDRRCDLYNLYHVLNHLNLFGGGYLRQALALIDRLLEK